MLRTAIFVGCLYWVASSALAYEVEKHDNGDEAFSRRAQHVFGNNNRATFWGPLTDAWTADVNHNGDSFGILDGMTQTLLRTEGKVQCYRDLPFGKWNCRVKDVFPDASHFSVETEQRGAHWIHWLKIFTKEQMSHCLEVKEEDPIKCTKNCRADSFIFWYFFTALLSMGIVTVWHLVCCDVLGDKCRHCGRAVKYVWSLSEHQNGKCKRDGSESVAAAVAEHERAREMLRRVKDAAENALEAQREALRRAKDADEREATAAAEVAQKMSASDTN